MSSENSFGAIQWYVQSTSLSHLIHLTLEGWCCSRQTQVISDVPCGMVRGLNVAVVVYGASLETDGGS